MNIETIKALKDYKDLEQSELNRLDTKYPGSNGVTLLDEYNGLLNSVDKTLLDLAQNQNNPRLRDHFRLALEGKMKLLNRLYMMAKGAQIEYV